MEQDILNNLGNPRQLEKLYRDNRTTFKRAFNQVYPGIRQEAIAQTWNERLNFEQDQLTWGTSAELIFVIVASFFAGLIAKIPDLTGMSPDDFYPRNLAFIFLPMLAAWFAWKQKVKLNTLAVVGFALLISAVYINVLPGNLKNDTTILACIHLPLLVWSLLGFIFIGGNFKNNNRRLEFLRYNGDMIVMTGLILIAGFALAAMTFGLFQLIGINIESFYEKYVVIWGLSAAPIVGTYLVQTNPQVVNKVSPVIAKIFTPLVMVTLVIYLFAIIATGKDPYNDREFLMIFNLLLIGVMAIILFSITEVAKGRSSKIETGMLLGLSVVTVIVNSIALSAILFRIAEWGITPNRLAVLGGNLLMLTNLVMVTWRLFKSIKDVNEIEQVEKSIASFLPYYAAWTVVVVFLFPLVFGFK